MKGGILSREKTPVFYLLLSPVLVLYRIYIIDYSVGIVIGK